MTLNALQRRRPARAIATLCAVCATAAHAQPVPSQVEWPSLGGDATRTAARQTPAPPLDPVRWTLNQTPSGQPIHFVGPASVAATVLPQPRLFTVGEINAQTRAIAVNAETGTIAWTAPLPSLILDSWSSPTLAGDDVLFAAGTSLIALRMSDGVERWRTQLDAAAVNASPAVTTDLGFRNRAFITNYGSFGGPTWLYCINISPPHERFNPHQPGDIVWKAPIGSAAGATPTYLDGVVYVATTGLDADGSGTIRAYKAAAASAPEPLWVFTNPIAQGFFGGLTIRESPAGPHLYAATYAFYGGTDSANLVKLNARTGDLVWSVPANRTNSIPLVLDEGRVILSSGLQGFGTIPMVQMFEDQGSSATELWNTATATWTDANNNGILDPGEFLSVGGWTTHPVLLQPPASTPRLLVGAIPAEFGDTGPYTDLYELDLSKAPCDPGFIVQQTAHAGSSPALLGAGVYSIGTDGLVALGPPPPRPDLTADGRVDIEDLHAWTSAPCDEGEQSEQDINRDGVVTDADRQFLIFEQRRNELRDMSQGRR